MPGSPGIGCAYYLQKHHPQRSYAILEARGDLGGTWDLFRFPGIRSDSDLHTFGFEFKPWESEHAIADGPEILDYIREAARENGIEQQIRTGHRVVSMSWSSEEARWLAEIQRTDTGNRDADQRRLGVLPAPATTAMTPAICRSCRASSAIWGVSPIRSSGRGTWTTRASASS